ncbi:sigma-70 family RNA polymerase sigma factor [Fulvivirgaceae bacterium BMA10]|uniref:Sigma-70 family RNA polymerase sigma factor n=1 Tax=Splendidivirga corallicola TaxID=3051826 RepID=A0ABT8KWE9_9BACT|nr:sigma-70 family RNA polymerase sigma factor [Fulvivirgaceae bacterium BMA10]
MSQADPTPHKNELNTLVDHLFRKQYGKMVSVLTSIFGFQQIEAVEDIVQDTLLEAFNHWSYGSVPDNPEGWLMQVAKNKSLNYLKREKNKLRVYSDHAENTSSESRINQLFLDTEIEDSMLRMIFACCQPIISKEDQVAIILKTLCGFGSKEIASALLIGEEAVNKRIYRAKQQIIGENIQLQVPIGQELNQKLEVVCTSLYLLFNEGYNSDHPEHLIRKDLCLEAMRLCKLLTSHFRKSTKVHALMALMCFHVARFESRQDEKGAIIIFEEQDRSTWNKELIQSGFYYLSEAAKGEALSAFHIEASIAAQHCRAKDMDSTNWKFIHTLYEMLYEYKPTPVIKLNLAIISSKIHGLDMAIEQLLKLRNEKKLQRYYLLYATLGEFYRQKKQEKAAIENFTKALSLTSSGKAKSFLQEKIEMLKG